MSDRYPRLRYDKMSSIDPIVSILNHLGDAGYLELGEAKMPTNKVDTLIGRIVNEEDGHQKYNFNKASFDDQANVYIMIRRKGIILVEKSNDKKVKRNMQLQQARIAEASQSLEMVVAYLGGVSVLVSIADWNWNTGGIVGNVIKVAVMLLTLILIYKYVSKKQKKDQ